MQTLPPNYQNTFTETYFYRQIQHNSQELKTTKDFFDSNPRIADTDNRRLMSFI